MCVKSTANRRIQMIKKVEVFTERTLPISYSVYGRRTNKSHRVEYLIDPKGIPERGYGIPEQVVLSRWKKSSSPRYFFCGMRMSPNTWRSIRVALGEDAHLISRMTIKEINSLYQAKLGELKALHYPAITGEKVLYLANGLGVISFEALLKRHNDPSRSKIFGTPDLYLWKCTKKTKTIRSIKFVEVKKPKEPLRSDQRDELNYLNNVLGIPSILLRLKEYDQKQKVEC